MKHIRLVCVGKLKEQYLRDAVAEYEKRLNAYCALETVELPDYADAAAREKECAAIAQRLKGKVIALDMGGALMSSVQFSEKLSAMYLTAPVVTVVIGGSTGLTPAILAKADLVLSFGRLTLPHQLMRIVALEQLYRALTIEAGTPYHK